MASKLQDEFIEILTGKKEVNEYELIVYKYIFISELNIPLIEEFSIEIVDKAFILYFIPDNLEFSVLRQLDDIFNKFNLTFMYNPDNLIKLKFSFGE